MGGQIDGRTGRWMDKKMDVQIDGQKDGWADRWTDRQVDWQGDDWTKRKVYCQYGRHTHIDG